MSLSGNGHGPIWQHSLALSRGSHSLYCSPCLYLLMHLCPQFVPFGVFQYIIERSEGKGRSLGLSVSVIIAIWPARVDRDHACHSHLMGDHWSARAGVVLLKWRLSARPSVGCAPSADCSPSAIAQHWARLKGDDGQSSRHLLLFWQPTIWLLKWFVLLMQSY